MHAVPLAIGLSGQRLLGVPIIVQASQVGGCPTRGVAMGRYGVSIVSYGSLWVSMGHYGVSMGSYGLLWVSVCPCGALWVAVGRCGGGAAHVESRIFFDGINRSHAVTTTSSRLDFE